MKFHAIDNRLKGDTPLRQCQLAEMYLLDVLVELCEAKGIRYFLSYGTLLGAMRHNGFIPWDDDIDVAIPEPDYKRLLEIAPSELPYDVILETPDISPGLGSFVRLRDRASFAPDPWTVVSRPCGIYIDIYQYVKYPRLPKRLSYVLTKFCTETWWSMWAHRTLEHKTTTGILISWIKCLCWQVLRVLSVFIFKVLRSILPNVWHGPIEIGFPNGDYPSELPNDVIFPLRRHKFESGEYYIPNKPEEYLTQRYGDWRQQPPIEKRQWHHHIILPTEAPDVWWAVKYKEKD